MNHKPLRIAMFILLTASLMLAFLTLRTLAATPATLRVSPERVEINTGETGEISLQEGVQAAQGEHSDLNLAGNPYPAPTPVEDQPLEPYPVLLPVILNDQ